jgi:hypothetical protein
LELVVLVEWQHVEMEYQVIIQFSIRLHQLEVVEEPQQEVQQLHKDYLGVQVVEELTTQYVLVQEINLL